MAAIAIQKLLIKYIDITSKKPKKIGIAKNYHDCLIISDVAPVKNAPSELTTVLGVMADLRPSKATCG